jgi:hypothetical protein
VRRAACWTTRNPPYADISDFPPMTGSNRHCPRFAAFLSNGKNLRKLAQLTRLTKLREHGWPTRSGSVSSSDL